MLNRLRAMLCPNVTPYSERIEATRAAEKQRRQAAALAETHRYHRQANNLSKRLNRAYHLESR